jgi:hypothetical protein
VFFGEKNPMLDMTKFKSMKYLLFGSLYFSEGLEAAIALVIIPVYLLEKGYPLPMTTIVAGIVTIPRALKFI